MIVKKQSFEVPGLVDSILIWEYGKKENWNRSVLVIGVLCILLVRKLYEELDDM